MDQKAIMQLLENMYKSADDMLFMADKKYAEANNPESDNYLIRDLFYEDLQFFKGYEQGIRNVLKNIRNYYCEEDQKTISNYYCEEDRKTISNYYYEEDRKNEQSQ